MLAYLRDPANAAKLGVDPKRIAIAGHSMGGWVTAQTAARDPALRGAVLISAADMGARGVSGKADPAALAAAQAAAMDNNRETLAGATGQSMADELIAGGEASRLDTLGPGLPPSWSSPATTPRHRPPDRRGQGGGRDQGAGVATDHGCRRLTLQALVINGLAGL